MLDAVGIVSEDLSQSAAFYRLLGAEFDEIAPEHWEAVTPSGVRLMLDSVELMNKLDPDWRKPEGGSAVVLCFKRSSAAEVDACHAAIAEAGFESLAPPYDAFWGQRYASVRDPDGNRVDIFADL